MKTRLEVDGGEARRSHHPPQAVLQVWGWVPVYYRAPIDFPEVGAKPVGLPRLGRSVLVPPNQDNTMQKRPRLGHPKHALL